MNNELEQPVEDIFNNRFYLLPPAAAFDMLLDQVSPAGEASIEYPVGLPAKFEQYVANKRQEAIQEALLEVRKRGQAKGVSGLFNGYEEAIDALLKETT